MDITFNGKFKSLQSFELKNLTGFKVATGKNGSGKTQFLEFLELEKTGRQDETTAKITSIKYILYVCIEH